MTNQLEADLQNLHFGMSDMFCDLCQCRLFDLDLELLGNVQGANGNEGCEARASVEVIMVT